VRVRGVGNKVLEARNCLSSLIVGRIGRTGRVGTIRVGRRRVGIGGRSRASVRSRVDARSRVDGVDERSRVDVMTREGGSRSVGGGTRVGGRSSVGGRRNIAEGTGMKARSASYRRTIGADIARRACLIINRIRPALDNCVTIQVVISLVAAALRLEAMAGFSRSGGGGRRSNDTRVSEHGEEETRKSQKDEVDLHDVVSRMCNCRVAEVERR
jgi:hypothetical protein